MIALQPSTRSSLYARLCNTSSQSVIDILILMVTGFALERSKWSEGKFRNGLHMSPEARQLRVGQHLGQPEDN